MRGLALAAQAVLAAAALSGCAAAPGESRGAYSIGLWGDLPYSAEQAAAGVPNLIADMNAHRLAFSVHNGDLKAGSGSPCDDALYERSRTFFDSLEAPAMFTPGDNDWTDCDRPSNGGYNSRERLDRERQVFFASPYSMGKRRLAQDVQQGALCLGVSGPVQCLENRRWTVGVVTYVTLNVQGSCNNLCDTAPDPDEYAARNRAAIRWLQESFATARQRGSAAVMLISQASPGWDEADPTRAPLRNPRTLLHGGSQPDGHGEFLAALRREVLAFGGPVAYVHGDSHYFRIDKPFLDSAGRRIENFTRVETFGNNPGAGNNEAHWVRVIVDPSSRGVFSWEPMVVPANRAVR